VRPFRSSHRDPAPGTSPVLPPSNARWVVQDKSLAGCPGVRGDGARMKGMWRRGCHAVGGGVARGEEYVAEIGIEHA
jgi:hypothetical protein